VTLKLQSRHFPPVTHYFSGGRFDRFAKGLPADLRNNGMGTTRTLTPRIFQHENIKVCLHENIKACRHEKHQGMSV
jgi:hypothetical protein